MSVLLLTAHLAGVTSRDAWEEGYQSRGAAPAAAQPTLAGRRNPRPIPETRPGTSLREVLAAAVSATTQVRT